MTDADARAIAITGMGAISTFGEGAGVLWDALRAGRSGIRPLRHERAADLRVRIAAQVPESFDPGTHFAERLLPMLDRTTQFALFAANEAVRQSGVDLRVLTSLRAVAWWWVRESEAKPPMTSRAAGCTESRPVACTP